MDEKVKFYSSAPRIDYLTGLPNIYGFVGMVIERLKEEPDKHHSILVSNIKGFSLINQLYGVEAGDEILINNANEMKKMAEQAPCLIFGRLDADRFVLLYETEMMDIDALIENSKHYTNFNEKTRLLNLHVQYGIYDMKSNDEDVAQACEKAAFALKKITTNGIVDVAVYKDEDLEEMVQLRNLFGHVVIGIENDEFIPYLQPQVDKNGNLLSAEVLLRWNSKELGFMNPASFIPLLEKANIIHEVDAYIWDKSFELLHKFKDTEFKNIPLSINVSPLDFNHFNLVDVFTSLARKYEVDPQMMNIEITEDVLINGADRVIKVINELQNEGFSVEIDDFGSGYSSLNVLKDLPAKVIKIDQVFLRETEEVEKAKVVLKHVIPLIQELGLDIVVEGVETKEQLDWMSELGCNVFQGYYFSKPLPVEEFMNTYKKTQ